MHEEGTRYEQDTPFARCDPVQSIGNGSWSATFHEEDSNPRWCSRANPIILVSGHVGRNTAHVSHHVPNLRWSANGWRWILNGIFSIQHDDRGRNNLPSIVKYTGVTYLNLGPCSNFLCHLVLYWESVRRSRTKLFEYSHVHFGNNFRAPT